MFVQKKENKMPNSLVRKRSGLHTHKRPITHKRDICTLTRDLFTHKRDLCTHIFINDNRDLFTHNRDIFTHKRGG